MIDVRRARAETPGAANRTHFNNCGAALMPTCVLSAVKDHLDLEAAIGGYEAAAEAAPRLERTYAALGRLLNCAPDEIAVADSATRAWDLVFYAMAFQPGERILTSSAEYASNYIPFLQVARRTAAAIEVVPDDDHGRLDVAALERMLDDRVRLVAVTHVPTNGGLINPAAEIGALTRARGVPFMLDACQSVGQLPLDVEALGVDVLSGTSRKYLRGPRGVGFVYVRRAHMGGLEPPLLDVHAADWTVPDRYRVRGDARRFETWEYDVAARIGLGVAVDYALDWGLEAIRDRVFELAERLRTELAAVPGVTIRDRGGPARCGIVSFTAEAATPDAIRDGLAERGVNVSVSRAGSTLLDMRGRGLDAVVRAGVHYYNTVEEIEHCTAAVRELLR